MGSGGVSSANYKRPLIDFVDGKFTHNGGPCRIVARRGKVSVGCSDITPEALRQLLVEYDRRFADEVVIQG